MKNEYWAVINRKGHIWPWTIVWNQRDAISRGCKHVMLTGLTRKSAWAKLRRRGCRIIKVQITEAPYD